MSERATYRIKNLMVKKAETFREEGKNKERMEMMKKKKKSVQKSVVLLFIYIDMNPLFFYIKVYFYILSCIWFPPIV